MDDDNPTLLETLQSKFKLQFPDVGSPIRASKSRLDAFEQNGFSIQKAWEPLDELLQQFGSEMLLYAGLPNSVVNFGTIEDKTVDARVYRGKDGGLAIALTSAVPQMLSKLTKLRLAAGDPGLVEHYNRSAASSMTAADYRALAREYIVGYSVSREVRGAYLELSLEGSIAHGAACVAAECFLLGHEIAHLVIDDFLSDNNPNRGLMTELLDNIDVESAADILGAKYSRNLLARKMPRDTLSQFGAYGIHTLFLLVHLGGIRPEYPDPITRSFNVLSEWLGADDAAKSLEREYSHGPWFAETT